MRDVLKWLLTGLLFAAAGGMVTWSYLQASGHLGEKGEKKEEEEDAYGAVMEGGASDEVRVERSETGDVTVTNINEEAKKRLGVEVKSIEPADRKPEIIAYGQLQEDPSAGYTLRAPIPGILHGGDQNQWPHIGEQVKSGAVIGAVEPRLSPVERADLASRLATARSEVEEIRASLDASRNSYESKKALNEKDKSVADRVVEEAKAKMKGEEAKLKAAEQNVRVFESSLTASSGPAGVQTLPAVSRDGMVVQVTAQPGEAVDTNQILLQLADFHQLLARIDFPVGEVVPAGVNRARIVVAGHDDHPIDGEKSALAASADSKLGGTSLLFRVSNGAFVMQPGMAVTAYVELPGEAVKGFLIPRSAIVRFGGKAWVYVQPEEDQFTRREVSTDRATAGGMFVAKGFTPEDHVAVRGGQALLAAELSFSSTEKEEE